MILSTPPLDYSPLPQPFATLGQNLEERLLQDAEQAIEVGQALHEAAKRAGNEVLLAYSELGLGRAYLGAQQPQAAAPLLAAAAARFRGEGRQQLAAVAQLHLGQASSDLRAYADAEAQLGAAIKQLRRLPDSGDFLATAINVRATLAFEQGQFAEALRNLQTALELEDCCSGTIRAICMTNMGIVYAQLGQYDKALAWLSSAYQICQGQPVPAQIELRILVNLAYFHHSLGHHALAVEVMESVFQRTLTVRDPWLNTLCTLNLGTYSIATGQDEQAQEMLARALEQSRQTGYRSAEMNALDSLGTLAERQGHWTRALALYQESLAIALDLQSPVGAVSAHLNSGRVWLQLGEEEQARAALERAAQLAQDAGTREEQAAVIEALGELAVREGRWEEAYHRQRELGELRAQLSSAEREQKLLSLSIEFEVERARRQTQTEVAARERAEAQVAERTRELARAQREIVWRLALAAEHRDLMTGDHIRRVGRLAARLARALGWSEDQAVTLGLAACLHDVGKIGVPDQILLKPSKLSATEFAQMQSHTTIGAQILSEGRSELLRLAQEIALNHHERWNGQGYPRGLRGESIPIAARIVAVADVYDALIQERPYKRAWTPAEAIAEIRAQAGQHFDPHIADLAVQIISSGLEEPAEAPLGVPDEALPGPGDEPPLELVKERTLELEETRQQAEHLLSLALSDNLTGLGNRRAFELELEHRLGRASPQGFTVISIDIDGLKQINDRLGHQSGDELLQAFAASLHTHVQGRAQAYRIGGDEFALITDEHVRASQCEFVNREVMADLRNQGFAEHNASFGVASYPRDATTAGDLLRVSDSRMYRMKLSRRSVPLPVPGSEAN